jgi:hypothetical protein
MSFVKRTVSSSQKCFLYLFEYLWCIERRFRYHRLCNVKIYDCQRLINYRVYKGSHVGKMFNISQFDKQVNTLVKYNLYFRIKPTTTCFGFQQAVIVPYKIMKSAVLQQLLQINTSVCLDGPRHKQRASVQQVSRLRFELGTFYLKMCLGLQVKCLFLSLHKEVVSFGGRTFLSAENYKFLEIS